jgi:hypothetical protein
MSTNDVASDTNDLLTIPVFENIYKKLLSLAFADAIHDDIISSQNVNNTITNTLQCTIFNRAMPDIVGVKPACPHPPGSNNGLQIDRQFKIHKDIEINVFQNLGILSKQLTTLHTHTHHDVTDSSSMFWTASVGTPVGETSDLSNNTVIKTNNNKIYHIKTVDWNIPGVDSSHPSVCGEILMQNLGMEDYDCVLHDAESVGIFKQFKKGPPSTKMLYYLMLPEFLADSATKKKWKKDKCLFSANGVQFRFAGKLESKYPCWRNNKRNTFFSDYFCEMKVKDWQNGFIEQVWNKSNAAGSVIGTQIGGIIKNPNKENNKTLIASTINKTKDADQKALAYQRKRSGDQFQALAIKRLTLGEQFHLSTSIGGNVLVDIPGGYQARPLYPMGVPYPGGRDVRKHTYLVTHDLTLCSYALHLGINVLFTHVVPPHKTKRIYSFRLISAIDNNN